VEHADGGRPRTSIGWEIDSGGLLDLLVRLERDYPAIPLYITENGAAFDDEVHDLARVAYLDGHLRACAEAVERGVPLRGYFAWSLLDNFEWSYGYAQRFGLVHVDYATQRRTLKDSARWYAEVIARGGLLDSLDEAHRRTRGRS
jgi:beta-glucosidase